MERKLSVDDIPELPGGYVTVAAIAERYGVNKGTIYHMIFKSQRFNNVFKVTKGGVGSDQRPLLLLLQAEVETVFQGHRNEEVDDPAFTRKTNEWNKRVKQWGRDTGWTETPIRVSGRPQRLLEEAYLRAVPADTRPGSR